MWKHAVDSSGSEWSSAKDSCENGKGPDSLKGTKFLGMFRATDFLQNILPNSAGERATE